MHSLSALLAVFFCGFLLCSVEARPYQTDSLEDNVKLLEDILDSIYDDGERRQKKRETNDNWERLGPIWG